MTDSLMIRSQDVWACWQISWILILLFILVHIPWETCTSNSEGVCLLVTLKIIMRGTFQDLFVLKCIYNLLVDHGLAVFYSCTIQKCCNPSFDQDLEFLSIIKLLETKSTKKCNFMLVSVETNITMK